MKRFRFAKQAIAAAALLLLVLPAVGRSADDEKPKPKLSSGTLGGLKFRSLGPGTFSGRIVDIAVPPSDPNTWYVAVGCGGIFKTTNHGVTFSPIFEDQKSYSVGCVTIDPSDPLTVWVGSGENNSQRSVGYGDGVYRSHDGGKSWKNVGLEHSEHIGMIRVDPRDSKVIYVAAMGPLWASGGDRGLYKSIDSGETWKKVLEIDENTGVNEVHLDPRNPDVIYATSYQRGRRVWTLVDGGPGSAIWKSTDGGTTWTKRIEGLPKDDLGRIGLAINPKNPDVVYALVEAANGNSATYRSVDGGGNWEKRSGYSAGGAQYYQELFVDPNNGDRVYSVDTRLQVTDDGGKNWHPAGERFKHVDNHIVWIDPSDSDHLLAGCDGGLYETYDRCATWMFFENLPITQFYKITTDNALPFYNVYGGTQDNESFGGPSRTTNVNGITNGDWFVTQGGDGFQTQVDPDDANIIYAQAQHAELVRFDRKSGQQVDIQPQPGPTDAPLRWNWDSPLMISPHKGTRLYFGAQRLYRTDDRGDTWTAVSPDLTRQLDRDTLPLMGRTWSIDAVARHGSTSQYGNIVSLSESPLVENLLYVGTDDGLVQVSEDGGGEWRKIERVGDVPEQTYVSRLTASRHNQDRVYGAFNNMKMGDFKPYLFRSDDRGHSWKSIAGDLPVRGGVWCVIEDPVDPNLLFCGTEFGLYATFDGGTKWIQLTGGLPTISVRDLAYQVREGDLVVGTFGRGFYILDDASTLRGLSEEILSAEAATFPVRPALMYFPAQPQGLREKAFRGEMYFTAPNPPFGATLTWYRKDDAKTMKKERQSTEKDLAKESKPIPRPTWEALTAEAREEDPYVRVTIRDEAGAVVRRLKGPAGSGFQRIAWDLRWPAVSPVSLAKEEDDNPFDQPPVGPVVIPGSYTADFALVKNGVTTPFGTPQTIVAKTLDNTTLPAADRKALAEFEVKSGKLQRAVLGAGQAADEAQKQLDHLQKAFADAPAADATWIDDALAVESRLKDLRIHLSGDPVKNAKNFPQLPSIQSRVNRIVEGSWNCTSAPTQTVRDSYDAAAAEFETTLADLHKIIEVDLKDLDARADKAGAPWTPGRVPVWTKE